MFLSLTFDILKDGRVKLSDFHISLLSRIKNYLLSFKTKYNCLTLGIYISCICGDLEILDNLEDVYREHFLNISKYNYGEELNKFRHSLLLNFSKDDKFIIQEFEKIKREKGYQHNRKEFLEILVNKDLINKNLSKYFSKKLTKVKMKELLQDIESKIRVLTYLDQDNDSLFYIRRLASNIIKDLIVMMLLIFGNF